MKKSSNCFGFVRVRVMCHVYVTTQVVGQLPLSVGTRAGLVLIGARQCVVNKSSKSNQDTVRFSEC